MGKALADFGMSVAQGAVGAGMGMLLGGYNDRRQRQQQEDLQNIQIRGQKEMADYNFNQQMKMWNATNYEAQKHHLKAAGLNPGLMYGMGGGGGTTASSTPGSVSGASAPVGGGEIGMGIQSAMQLSLLKAQKENIEADTQNKQAETAIKPLQGQAIQAGTELTKTNAAIAKLDQWIKDKSKEDQTEIIMWQSEKILNEVEKEARENITNKATQQDRIDTVKAELAAKALMPELIKAQTSTEKGKPALQEAQIAKMQADVQNEIQNRMQRWEALYQQGVNMGEGRLRALMQQDAEELKVPLNLLEMVAQGIIFKKMLTPTTVPTKEVGGFHKR